MFFIANFFSHQAVDGLLAVTEINDSDATRTALLNFETQSDRFDVLGLGLLIGLVLFVLISGWLVGGHPVFMIIYFFIVIVSVALSAVFANTWESVTTASIFGATIGNFPIMNHILSYLPVYVAVIGIAGMIVMFSKMFIVSNSSGGHL